VWGRRVRDWFQPRNVWPNRFGGRFHAAEPWTLVPIRWQGWALTLAWLGAALATLSAAFLQGPSMFLTALLAVTLGTVTGLRLLLVLTR